jgi:hypothetical protein
MVTGGQPTPAKKPTQAASSGDFDFDSPMGTGAEAIMAVAGPRKTTTKGFDPSAIPEQFASGVAGMQQGYYATAAKTVGTALNVMDRIDKGEAVPDSQDPTGYQHLNPEQRAQVRSQFKKALTGNVAKTIAYNAEQQEYVKNPNADAMVKAANEENWGKAWKAFSDDPAGVIQQLSVQSAPNALPSLIGGAAGVLLRGGVPALMVGLGTGSFPVEYMSSIVDSLKEAKVNMKDAGAVEAKLRDPKFLEEAGKKAVTRATVISAADAASGKLLLPLRAKQLGKNVARGGANVATEIGTEMGGEAAAQIASGEDLKYGEIIAEGLGAGPQAVTTTALKTIESTREKPEATTPPPPPAAPPATPDAPASTSVQAGQIRAEKIAALTQVLELQGIPADNAGRIATRKVDAELKAENKTAAIKIPEGRVEEITQDLIAAGVNPQQAKLDAQKLAQEEAQADELAQSEAGGTTDVAEPISGPSGERVAVPAQPADNIPAPAGVGEVKSDGVVSARQDVAEPAEGKGTESVAVKPEEDYANKSFEELENLRSTADQTNDALDMASVRKHFGPVVAAEYESMSRRQRNKWWDENATEALDRDASTFNGVNEELLDEYIKAHNNFDTESPNSLGRSVGLLARKINDPGFVGSPDFVTLRNALAYAKQQGFSEAEVLGGMRERASEWAGADAQELFKDLFKAKSDKAKTPKLAPAVVDKRQALKDAIAKRVKPTPPIETEGTTTDGTETTETVQAKEEGQTAPAAGAVSKSRRGRPPSPHIVVKNPEGKFDHVTNGEVVATYDNQKQATAAANLAKAKDKGDADLIAKNQAKLDAALASKGRGRPEKTALEDGAPALDNEAKSEIAELESALNTYNSPAEQESILNAAMYIYDAANDATAPAAVRERAKQMLDEELDPKDVARSKTLRSSDAKVGKPDTGFSKLTNGSQAIAHIIKTGNLFQRFVAQRIRNFVVGVKFVVVERGDPIPAEMEGARGLFVYTPGSKERTIYVRGASFGSQQGINIITVLHELLHAATASRIEAGLLKGFKNASLQKFMREMESLMKRTQEAYEEAELFGDLSPEMQELVANTTEIDKKTGRPVIGVFADPREFLAYGMSSPEFQKFLMSVQGKRGTGFSGFVDSIRDLFGVKTGDATAFTDLVDITDKMLGTRLTRVKTKGGALQQKGKFTPPEFDEQADLRAKRSAAALERDARKAKQKVAESREGDISVAVKAMQNERDPSKVRDVLARAWGWMDYKQRELSVRQPTFDFLARWAEENGISSLRQTNMYLERMLGMSQQFLAGSEQMIGMLNRGFKEDKSLSRKQFEKFVYATTIAEIDPSDPNAVERSKTLDADYKALGPVGQRMYKDLRNYYEGVIELYSDLLDDQIQNAQGLSQEDKNNLMATLRKTFEAKARIRPYFPLVRRGDFWLAIGSGERRRFYTFESRGDRNAKAAELAAGRGDDIEDLLFRQEFVEGNDLGSLRMASKDSSQMLKQTFDAIDRMEMGDDTLGVGSAKEGLKDAVYQIYLNTMPEQTFRKQFTHRKNVIGFSTDIQQNIATTASKQAIQLSRLKYAPLLRTSLSAARDAIREREELSPFVQEAEKRINMALSGQDGSLGEAVAGVANKASFFWFLSGASSALIQPSSVFISGLPILAGNYNDVAGAAKELGKMTLLVNQYSVFRTNADGTTSISAPSIANSKSLPADERKAVSEMVSRGVSESTYASMVWGYKRTPTESTYFSRDKGVANIPVAWGKGKNLVNFLVGALMHNTERLSREAVYLAAYRLGKKQGLSYEDAVQKAVESTNEALGNYDVTNKPRYMQQGIGKVAFQFKTYPLQMTLLLLTNFKKMLPFLNKEGKKEAITKFFGMMGTSYLLAGVANMALFSPIIGLIGWAWGQMSDDEDWPEELKDMSFETWFLKVFLPEKLGDVKIGGVPVSDLIERGPLNALTGYDIASRIGLNDLWGRDSKETKTSRESAIAFILDNFGGPTASLLLGFADAWDAYALGDYQKMQEKLAPAAIRNLLVANKYADEGMKTGRGVELVNKNDVKTGELIGQAIGFRPDILAATQGPAFKLTGTEQKILNQRNLLLNKLDFQLRKDTDEGDKQYIKIREKEVANFNAKYPSYELTDDAIDNSLLKKAEQRASSRAGVLLTEKNIPIVEEATNYLERRLDERAKEMADKRKAEKNPR